jgi:hypothetical protein
MTDQPISMTAEEFVAELEGGSLEAEQGAIAPIVLFGLAKGSGDNPDALLFSHGTRCGDWVEVPLSQIEQVEVLKTVRCRDHSHPLVQIHLKLPDDGFWIWALAKTPAGPVGGRPPEGEIRGPRRIVRRQRSTPLRFGSNGGIDGAIPIASGMTGGCADVSDYEIDSSGQVWCLDWCWEHDGYTESAFHMC